MNPKGVNPFGFDEPEGIRTPDPRLRRPLLYPAELQTHIFNCVDCQTSWHFHFFLPLTNRQLLLCICFRFCTERVMGIEPTYPAWKAGVLPLNYTRISIGVTGFEPATSWSQTRRSSQTEPHPVIRYECFFMEAFFQKFFLNRFVSSKDYYILWQP